MNEKTGGEDLTAASKFLSYVLRHAPESIGVTMDGGGWVDVAELVSRSGESSTPLTVDLIQRVIATSAKQRFALSKDGTRVRANQGHSVAIDLGLDAASPPPILFHGTADRFLKTILVDGLIAGQRTHVHLSADRETAKAVGGRHGKPVILTVDSAAMAADGMVFHQAENGVWLTDSVPANYLSEDRAG